LKFLRWCVIVASAIPVAIGQTVPPEPDSANVKVVVSETFGRPVPGAKVTLTSVVPGGKFAAVGGEAEFDHVPFGIYDLDVRLPGFVARKERVNIHYPELLFRIGLELGAIHSDGRSELSGSIKSGVGGRSDLWVRLMALYSSDLIENAVDDAGTFELDGMAHGKYLLIMFEKDKVLATKPVDVLGGKQTVELTLESK
jgi:hypothetical protein